MSGLSLLACLTACSDESNENSPTTDTTPTDLPEWYYAGGELGTSYLFTMNALEQPSPAIENAVTSIVNSKYENRFCIGRFSFL